MLAGWLFLGPGLLLVSRFLMVLSGCTRSPHLRLLFSLNILSPHLIFFLFRTSVTNAQPQQTTVLWRASLPRIPSLKTLHQSCPGGGSHTRVSAGTELGHSTAG